MQRTHNRLTLYLIGALRNRGIIELANEIRELGYEVVDDWISPGEAADEKWQEYEAMRGRTYKEALNGLHAGHVFDFDLRHLDRAEVAVMVMPCGRSGHLELGYAVGRGKLTYVLFEDEPNRYDIMYRFADDVFMTQDGLLATLGALISTKGRLSRFGE